MAAGNPRDNTADERTGQHDSASTPGGGAPLRLTPSQNAGPIRFTSGAPPMTELKPFFGNVQKI
jgi:hypothetical protein